MQQPQTISPVGRISGAQPPKVELTQYLFPSQPFHLQQSSAGFGAVAFGDFGGCAVAYPPYIALIA